MVLGFSLHCFFKCNLHFQSVLICWVLIAGNVTKTSIRNWILPIPNTSQLNTFKAILLTIFCSMDETLDIRLPLWFAISNSALKGNSLKKNSDFYWNLIKLYSTQNGCGHVCVPYANVTPCKLMEESAIMGLPSIIAYVPPSWSVKWKKFRSKQMCCITNY